VTFDESLPALVKVLLSKLDKGTVEAGTVLRDATGCLAFFAASALDPAVATDLRAALTRELGVYARPDRVLAEFDAPGVARVLAATPCTVRAAGCVLRLVDRRIVGADWLHAPRSIEEGDETTPPRDNVTSEPVDTSKRTPRVAFASMKGGVGRSTALSVVAASLAAAGRNILLVDLDIEAPGVGSLVLSEAEKPAYGALDYLVELNFGPVTIPLESFVATCAAKGSGAGIVDLVPVAGSRSDTSPENYLAKLARAMTEAVATEGNQPPISLAGKVQVMLQALEARRTYDIVLVDGRAGLAEVAAVPILALDADVLLFGTAQRQTLDDFRFLFAHLSTLVSQSARSPWTSLKMVHAKALTQASITDFKDKLWELFGEYLYEEEGDAPFEAFNFDVDDKEAPHFPLVVPFEAAFHDYDPFAASSPASSYFERTFGEVTVWVESRLERR
jgi:hypothetical protein